MKNNIIILCCVLLFSTTTFTLSAQRQNSQRMNMQEFEKRKMEYIQKEAGLTDDEATLYFPLNNELTKKKFELHRQHRENVRTLKENNNISEEEYRKLIESDVDIRIKEASLDKEYAPKFEKVLSPEKLFRAQQAEREFMQHEVAKFRQNTNRGNVSRQENRSR